jgi:hypothetical protein
MSAMTALKSSSARAVGATAAEIIAAAAKAPAAALRPTSTARDLFWPIGDSNLSKAPKMTCELRKPAACRHDFLRI